MVGLEEQANSSVSSFFGGLESKAEEGMEKNNFARSR